MCGECRTALGQVQADCASYAAVQPMEELPHGAKDRFLARLSSDTAPVSTFVKISNRSRTYIVSKAFRHWLESPAPMFILSGVLAAALLFVGYDDLSHIHQIRQMQPAVQRFEKASAQFDDLKQFLQGANAQQVTLHRSPLGDKEPEGHVLYSATTGRLVFTASNLPGPPPGKAYELWLLPAAGGAPIPAGVFSPDLQGSAAVVFPEIPPDVQASGFGVTVEDAAGSRAPTTPIYLSGQ
jgi:hypothetical protein